jgi:DMSO/TMAO reductase YedYZ molybdopterin-dependent catalytic subunit
MNKLRVWTAAAVLVLVALAAVVLAGAFVPGGMPQANAADPAVLTVTGNGQTKTFTMAELQALPVYEGYSGIINSAGTVTPPGPVRGVKLTDLMAEVGGIPNLQSTDITASDGYGMTLTYDEVVNGNINMYNATTKQEEAAKAPVSVALLYEENGAPIPPGPGGDGPLRLAVCQPTDVGQVAAGHLNVKWVNRVALRSAVVPWTVKMYGLKDKHGKRQTYTLDRLSYDSCATPGCHGSSWVSPAPAKTWTGVPLFLCIGKVDGGKGHGGYGAYNEALALKGYRIKITSATGASAIIGSRTIRNQDKIILANKLQGSELTADYYPLRLVGPKIGSKSFIGQVVKIQMLPK